jgi:hypothetical protein
MQGLLGSRGSGGLRVMAAAILVVFVNDPS